MTAIQYTVTNPEEFFLNTSQVIDYGIRKYFLSENYLKTINNMSGNVVFKGFSESSTKTSKIFKVGMSNANVVNNYNLCKDVFQMSGNAIFKLGKDVDNLNILFEKQFNNNFNTNISFEESKLIKINFESSNTFAIELTTPFFCGTLTEDLSVFKMNTYDNSGTEIFDIIDFYIEEASDLQDQTSDLEITI